MLGIVFDTQERKGQGARSNAPAFLPGIVFDTQERKGQGAKSNVPAFLPGIVFDTQEGGELCCVQGNFPLFAEVSFSIPKSEKTTFRSGYGATALCGVSFSIPRRERGALMVCVPPPVCWVSFSIPMNRGGIRIHMNRDGKYGTIEMAIKPTAEQKKKLRSFISAVGGNVDIDFMDENYNTTHSVSYEGVSPTRALSGITTFYDKGIKPEGNVSYSLARLPKAEYGRLASIIMTRQHTYHRPPFDYAFTLGKFYVYNYLGDGDFIVNFALPIEDKYKEAISLISKSIDDGVVNSTGSLNSFLETARSGEGDDIADLVNVLKERAWYQGVHTSMPSRQGGKARGVSNVGKSDSGKTTARGANRRNSSSNPQSLEESYSLNRTDIDYLDAVNRERTEIERKAKADGTWLKAPNGKDTNLSPEQWVDVRTKAFKEWFGDWENDSENASKIIDENGEPRVMYHGSSWKPLREVDGKAVFNMFEYTRKSHSSAGYRFRYLESLAIGR